MITYRTEKGAPLTAMELDQNFRELEERIQALEALLESALRVPESAASSGAAQSVGEDA